MSSLQNYLKSCAFAAVSLFAGTDQQAVAQSYSPAVKPDPQVLNEAFRVGFSMYANDSVAQVMKLDLQENMVDYSINGLPRRQKVFSQGGKKIDTYIAAANEKIHTIMRTLDKPNEVYETVYQVNPKKLYQIPEITLFYRAPLNDTLNTKREIIFGLDKSLRQPGPNGSDYRVVKDVLTISNKDNMEKRLVRSCEMVMMATGKPKPCSVTLFEPGSDPDTRSVGRQIEPHGIVTTKFYKDGKAPTQNTNNTLQDYENFVSDIKKVTGLGGYNQVKNFVEPWREHFYENEFVLITKPDYTRTPQMQPKTTVVAKPKPKAPVKRRSRSSHKPKPR